MWGTLTIRRRSHAPRQSHPSVSNLTPVGCPAALGRVMTGKQVSSGQTYHFSYTYSLAGGVLTETYPSGRVINTGYATAGRLSSLTGQKSGESYKTCASSYSYAAHGGVSSMQLGDL